MRAARWLVSTISSQPPLCVTNAVRWLDNRIASQLSLKAVPARAELKLTISARPQLIGSVSLLLAAGWSQPFLYWMRSNGFLNAGGDFKIKGLNRNESDPTRRKEVIFTDWLLGIFSQQSFFRCTWRHSYRWSEYVSENMNVWMLQCLSFTPLKTRWAERGFTRGERDFMYESYSHLT